MGLKCLTETCYLSAEFLPDSFCTGPDAVRVLEEQMLAGIEPDNTSTAQADFELFVRNLRDLLLVRARARALLNRGTATYCFIKKLIAENHGKLPEILI